MPFINFDSRHFSATEQAAIDNAFQVLKELLKSKIAILTAEERQRYLSISEQNRMLVNKVKEYNDSDKVAPQSNDEDWHEILEAYHSRNFLNMLTIQLSEILRGLDNAKILHDSDIIGKLR